MKRRVVMMHDLWNAKGVPRLDNLFSAYERSFVVLELKIAEKVFLKNQSSKKVFTCY